MLKMANLATDAVAFYCLPNGQSTVLRNKRQELVSKRSEFAEIGMKAALAAANYRAFDPDNNGLIEAVDIVKVFAHVEGVSWSQAHAIAHMILADADTSDAGETEGGPGGLDFIEFMTCLEGDAINFDQFLKNVEPVRDATDEGECRDAFDEVRASLPQVQKGGAKDVEKGPPSSSAHGDALPDAAPLPPPGEVEQHL
jgi:Ca2+-binding EF-hand superfamily protein